MSCTRGRLRSRSRSSRLRSRCCSTMSSPSWSKSWRVSRRQSSTSSDCDCDPVNHGSCKVKWCFYKWFLPLLWTGVITKAVHKSSEEEKKEEETKKTIEQHDNIVTQYKELIREQVNGRFIFNFCVLDVICIWSTLLLTVLFWLCDPQDSQIQELKEQVTSMTSQSEQMQTTVTQQVSQIQQHKDQYNILKLKLGGFTSLIDWCLILAKLNVFNWISVWFIYLYLTTLVLFSYFWPPSLLMITFYCFIAEIWGDSDMQRHRKIQFYNRVCAHRATTGGFKGVVQPFWEYTYLLSHTNTMWKWELGFRGVM